MQKFNINVPANLKVEEDIQGCVLYIEPGGICVFNRRSPSNGLHFHNCYELCLVISGSGEFVHNTQKIKLASGDLFIADPGILHEINIYDSLRRDGKAEMTLFFLRFLLHGATGYAKKSFEQHLLSGFLQNHQYVAKHADHLFSYLYFLEKYGSGGGQGDYGMRQAIRNLALEGMYELSKHTIAGLSPVSQSRSILDTAVTYIGQNLSRKLRLTDIARHCSTSQRNLQYLFRRHLGKKVVDYINERRMSIAGGYLKMNFKVADVCELVGVNEPSSFCRLFKKYYGVTPKRFQQGTASEGMLQGADFHCRL